MKTWITRLLLCVVTVAPPFAHAEAVFGLESASARLGDSFEIAVSISSVDAGTGLGAWQFDLAFDPTILQATSVDEGPFLSSSGGSLFGAGVIDNVSGLISLVTDAYVDLPPLPSGAGVLATVHFSAIGLGHTALTPSNVFLDFADTGFSTLSGDVTVLRAAVPEPGTLSLSGLGIALLALIRRRKFNPCAEHRAATTTLRNLKGRAS